MHKWTWNRPNEVDICMIDNEMGVSVAPDRYDAQRATRATGLLAVFNEAGVLAAADVHVAQALVRLGEEPDERVQLAAALAVRGVRLGSVCVDLRTVADAVTTDDDSPIAAEDLPWPDQAEWEAACAASAIVATASPAAERDRGVVEDAAMAVSPAVGADPPLTGGPGTPLRLVGGLLFLDRYWRQEQTVRSELAARAGTPPVTVDEQALRSALQRLFPGPAPDGQRLAAAAAATGSVTVVAGGPGTGKTTTVARLIAVLLETLGPATRVALAAPTGKAAARLEAAVAEESRQLRATGTAELPPLTASTVHRLLGWRPGSRNRFRHDRGNRLPYDVVVVDETSMVSLTLMSRLFEAVRADARLVLVGDPDQLASVEAGAVLGDLAARPTRPAHDPRLATVERVAAADLTPDAADDLRRDVVRLTHQFRFGGAISDLAAAIRAGDADAVLDLLAATTDDVEFVDLDAAAPAGSPAYRSLRTDVETAGRDVTQAARAGDVDTALAALDRHRVLCAHRSGPYGVTRWSLEVQHWQGITPGPLWAVGQPLLVTTNDYELGLFNGDTGVVVVGAAGDPVAAFGRPGGPVTVGPGRLAGVQSAYAMTVHRAQGSQYDRATVILPPVDSPLLTRELLYTAATRARRHVRIVGTADAVRRAVETPVVRASGLRTDLG
jgi:exodeoxyribonuclease V alpha subunit